MNKLYHLLEVIKVDGRPHEQGLTAYKMDGTDPNNMRKMINLGTCHCCDYFLQKRDAIIIIEETMLLGEVRDIREKYHYLNDTDSDDIINVRLGEKMQLKVYGALLVLCRLATKYPDAENLIGDKKYRFWIVVSSIKSEDRKYFEYLRLSLRGSLRGLVGSIILDDVEVFSSDVLEDKISEN